METEQETESGEIQDQLIEAEGRAENAEKLLNKAKKELLSLTTDDTRKQFEKLQEQMNQMERQNQELTASLKSMNRQLQERQKDASRWRGRFLLSEIDVVAASDRAEKAEKELSEAVKPVPYDERQLILERDLSWMAFKDPITGLGNGNKLDLELKSALNTYLPMGKLIVLFIIDLDKFSAVNDFGGWEQGNWLLRTIGERLKAQVPDSTRVVRRSEDEFGLVVVLDGPGQSGMTESPLVRCRQIADFIKQLISVPVEINHQMYPVTCSIGISVCPDDSDTPAEMLDNAYSAVATCKAKGGNQYKIYSDKVYEEKEQRANLAAELKECLIENSLAYLFRPVADVQRGNLVAAVVEPYWDHPAHGRVSQADFMPLAEDYGLMPQLVAQMISAGCELARKLKGTCYVILRCPSSILKISEFSKHLLNAINAARIKPNSVVLDLPAEALNQNPVEVKTLFTEIGRWGTGCSLRVSEDSAISLSQVQQSAASLLSLTPDMMDSVPAQESRRSVIQSFLDIANRLDTPILVEGVADSSQAHFLANHKCHWASGDFISPSLNLKDFIGRRRTTWRFK